MRDGLRLGAIFLFPDNYKMTIVTLTRNSCCHHARVWNKQNTIRPMRPNHMSGWWRCYKKPSKNLS